MKTKDFKVLLAVAIILLPFFISDTVYNFYAKFNAEHGMITSFLKFALLATLGESIGLRIRTGNYNHRGFGLLPRAIVWGFIGLTIKLAFIIFATGVPIFLEYLGLSNATAIMKDSLSLKKVLVAFSISAMMNIIYAPVMMTFHKITDAHITKNNGKFIALVRPIHFSEILSNVNWNVQWNFVFAKTIPFFWIPAHTITFLLPPDFQVLFAALLSVALGLILAIASLKGSKK